MSETIGRNEPCPCGSGKKYKNCCGGNEAVPITQMIEREISGLQEQIIHFAFNYFGNELEEDLEDLEDYLELESEEEKEFFQFVHAAWFTLFKELDDGERIIEKFIAKEEKKLKRLKVKQILQSWTGARTIAGVTRRVNGNRLTVVDGLTGEELEVIIPGDMGEEMEVDEFFLAIIVPFEKNYVFFPVPFSVGNILPEHALEYIEESCHVSGYDSPNEYLADFFLEVLNELPMLGSRIDLDDVEWANTENRQVAEIFQLKLDELDVPAPVIDTGIILWHQFCENKQVKIENPFLYAAALHFLESSLGLMGMPYSPTELAQLYGVQENDLIAVQQELATVLTDEIEELMDIMEDEDDDVYQDGFYDLIDDVMEEVEKEGYENIEEIIDRKINEQDRKK